MGEKLNKFMGLSLPPVFSYFSFMNKRPTFERRLTLASMIIIFLQCLNYFIIPELYMWAAEVPPPLEELRVSQGEFVYKKNSLHIHLKEDSGQHLYSCQSISDNHYTDCFYRQGVSDSGIHDLKDLAGKEATVWWYESAIYPWGRRRQMMRLVIDGQEKLTYDEMMRGFMYDKGWIPNSMIIGLFTFFISFYLTYLGHYNHVLRNQNETF